MFEIMYLHLQLNQIRRRNIEENSKMLKTLGFVSQHILGLVIFTSNCGQLEFKFYLQWLVS